MEENTIGNILDKLLLYFDNNKIEVDIEYFDNKIKIISQERNTWYYIILSTNSGNEKIIGLRCVASRDFIINTERKIEQTRKFMGLSVFQYLSEKDFFPCAINICCWNV